MRRVVGPSFSRSAFYIMDTLFHENVIEITKKNRNYLSKELVDLSLDNNKGSMQDKSVILKRLLGNQFDPEQIYNYFHKQTGINVTCARKDSNITVDTRIFSELPTLVEYHKTFGPDILRITANLDNVPIKADGLKQSHPDFSINAKVMPGDFDFNSTEYITYIEDKPTKLLIHDEKSMGGMLTHSTSGSIGVLPYTSDGQIIIPLKKIITTYDLIDHNKNNLNAIGRALEHDGHMYKFRKSLLEAQSILTESDPKKPLIAHNNYQRFMWNNIQRHPSYNRTLSYILPREISFTPSKDRAFAFEVRFKELLNDVAFTKGKPANSIYNLDKQGDYLIVCRAMLRAYKETCNPKLGQILQYTVYEEKIFNFHPRFANELASIIKNDPWFQY